MKSLLKNHFNLYFFIPFLLWCILGGFLLYQFDAVTLFTFINEKFNPILDTVMEWMTRLGEGPILVVIGLVFFYFKPFRNRFFFFAGIFSTLIPSITTHIIKYEVAAPRPMVVYADEPWVHHLNHWALLHNNSFPSGHTTGVFSFFCMLAFVMPSKYKAWGFLFFIIALATGYSRVYLAAHFFADIYVGSIIGTVFSFLICVFIYAYKYKQRKIV